MRLGLLPIVFLIFLTCKLTHQIAWSWWWVFSPLFAWVVIVFIYMVIKEVNKSPYRK